MKLGNMLQVFLRLAISMGIVMAVMGLAARYARRRQGFAGRRRANARKLPGSNAASKRAPRPARTTMSFFGRPRGTAGEAPAEVLHRLALTKGTWAVVLAAGGKTLLVGVTDQRVELLAELPSALDNDLVLQSEAGTADSTTKHNWSPSSSIVDPVLTTSTVPPTEERPASAWKLAIDSLRERTVRR
jgi:hypothetical protein